MRTKILTDVFGLIATGKNLPDFGDEDATAAYFGTIAPGLVHIAYDAMKTDAPKACAALQGDPTPDEWKSVGAIGDGHILQWLTTNGPAILQFVMTIISIIPKKPA